MDGTWGRFEDFKDQMENLDQFMNRFRVIYTKETNIPTEELERLLKRDVYMDSARCLEWGVIDDVWK
jgi:ATP-dependent protease ClpP protease subunit